MEIALTKEVLRILLMQAYAAGRTHEREKNNPDVGMSFDKTFEDFYKELTFPKE